MARVLALDYGSARCGCALSDPTGTLATPSSPCCTRHARGIGRLAELVREREVERVVVGLPLGMSGADTAQTEEARAFAARLAERLGPGVPVELYDERLTTVQALRDPAGGASLDSRAAAHLLEAWLAARPPQRDLS